MSPISDAINELNRRSAQAKDSIRESESTHINDILHRIEQDIINNVVLENLENDGIFTHVLARNIKNVIPIILRALAESKGTDNFEQVANATDSIINLINTLTDPSKNVFDTDNISDKETLEVLENTVNEIQNHIETIAGKFKGSNKVDFKEVKENFKSSAEDLKKRLEPLKEEEKEPEDISLHTKVLKDELKDAQNYVNDFRNSLVSLFNIQATSDLSATAAVFENINKSAMSANEAIETMHELFISGKIDTPGEFQSAQSSLETVRIELENLINNSQQVTSNIAQASLGDITNFYTKLLSMGSSANISFGELKTSIRNLNISDSEKEKLEQELENNKKKIEELLKISHNEFSTAFSKRIDSIITGIDDETNKVLNQFAAGKGLSQQFTSAFNQSGRTASNIWQIATGIEQTKDRFSLFNVGFGGRPNLSNIKQNVSEISQIQFELSNATKNFTDLFDTAQQQKQKGLHKQSEQTLQMAHDLFADIVKIQYEFSMRAKRAIKQWNNLSERERKRLDPEGKMDSQIKSLTTQVKSGNLAIIAMKENFNIRTDTTTTRQIEALKEDTRDLTKLERESRKAEDKAKETMKELSSIVRDTANQIRSVISDMRNTFNSFGNLGLAFAGPIETLRKAYEYYRKQGQQRYAGMSIDASIGYSNLEESALRTQQRLIQGDELFVRSGGRIDRDAYDKQYQMIIKNIGGRYGNTSEQTVQEAEEITEQITAWKNIYGIDDSTIQQLLKTYMKDMNLSPEETVNAIATLSAQAQAANVPLGQYLSKVASLAETFMQVGLQGEQASIILNQLLQSGVRMEVAEAVTSQVASVASKFADDKNKIAFAAVMRGEDPFRALAQASYTHDAKGNPRREWGKEMGANLDAYINTIMPVAGNDPNLQRMLLIQDILKPMGFDQRAASMIASRYLDEGNTEQFQEFFTEQLEKMENPNKTMEDLNRKITDQLDTMVRQLAASDRINAKLDSQLWHKAEEIGKSMDSVLNTFAPIILEFQKQMLKFSLEALKFIQKLITSDLFKSITNSIVETIGKIPDFLSEIDNKIDELFGWIQGKTNENKEENRKESEEGPSNAAIAAGIITSIVMPGGIIGKAAGGYIATKIVDNIINFIQDKTEQKDEQGNLIKDEKGNIQYNNPVAEWITNNDRSWNDTNNSVAAVASMAAVPYAFNKLGKFSGLALTGEQTKNISSLTKLAHGGIRALIAGLIGYGIHQLFSSKKAEAASISEPETIVLGTSTTINNEQDNIIQNNDYSTATFLGGTAGFAGASVFFNNLLTDKRFVSMYHRARISNNQVPKALGNLIIAPFKDLIRTVSTLAGIVFDMPSRIIEHLSSLFTDMKTFLKAVPSFLKNAFIEKFPQKWNAAARQIANENLAKKHANSEELLKLIRKGHDIAVDDFNATKNTKWLPSFYSTRNLHTAENILNKISTTGNYDQVALEKLIDSSGRTHLTEEKFTQIDKLIKDQNDLRKLQKQLNTKIEKSRNLVKAYKDWFNKNSNIQSEYMEKRFTQANETLRKQEAKLAEINKSISRTAENLGKEINSAKSLLNRMINIGFIKTRQTVKQAAKSIGNVIVSARELLKQAFIDTGKTFLNVIAKIFNTTSEAIINTIKNRGQALIKPFQSIFKGIRTLAQTMARFLGITQAAKGGTQAAQGIRGILDRIDTFLSKSSIYNKFKDWIKLTGSKVGGALKFVFKKLPIVGALYAAGSFGSDLLTYLDRGMELDTALLTAGRNNAELIAEAVLGFAGPVGWAATAANELLPMLNLVGFDVPKETLIQMLGNVTGIHISASPEEITEKAKEGLLKQYPELTEHPEILQQMAEGKIGIEQAAALIANPELVAVDANFGDDAVADLQRAINQDTMQGVKDDTQALINSGQEALNNIAQSYTDDNKQHYNDPLKELEKIQGDNSEQDVQALINEYTINVNKEYEFMVQQVANSNLSDEKKTEILSKLEEKHFTDINNIEKLKENSIDIKTVNESYIQSKKEIEQSSGLSFNVTDNEQLYNNINQRYYIDPLSEAERILTVTDMFDDTNKNIINKLINEHNERINKDYQYITNQINNSDLSIEKKQELNNLVREQYESAKNDSNLLKTNINNAQTAKDALSTIEQADTKYMTSKKEIESITGINYEDKPETAYEADQSRKEITMGVTKAINDEQKESQRLQKIINTTLDDFMDLHENLMIALQKSITTEHENIYNMIGVTHKILMDLQQIIGRAGALIVSTISSSGGHVLGASTTINGGDINAIINQPEIEAKLEAAAKQFNIDPALLKAVAHQESRWNQQEVSPMGAIGVMQLMPETAASLGVDPRDLDQNIYGGAKYLRSMLDMFNGDVELALAAYNSGPGTVQKSGGVPNISETQKYVSNVLKLQEQYANRNVLPTNAQGYSIGDHTAEIQARNDARAISQGLPGWRNRNEQEFYEVLKQKTALTDNEIAGVMGYVDYVNPNYDTILNNEHGGFFALGPKDREKAMALMNEWNDHSLEAQIKASLQVLNIRHTEDYNRPANMVGGVIAMKFGWNETNKEAYKQIQANATKRESQLKNLMVNSPTVVVGASTQVRPYQNNMNTGNYISQFSASYKPEVSCTDTSATMMYNMYKGTNLSVDEFRNQFGTWSMNSVMLNQLNSWSADISDPNSSSMQQVYNNLQSGKPTLLYYQHAVGPNAFTNSGMHAVIALGVNSDGSIQVANPNDKGFSAIQNVSWNDITSPLAQGNVLAAYTPSNNPLNIITGIGQAATTTYNTSINSGQRGYSMQEAYNIIMGAPINNTGMYQINPYEEFKMQVLQEQIQANKANNEKIFEEYRQRKIERDKKYGTQSQANKKIEADKQTEANKQTETNKEANKKETSETKLSRIEQYRNEINDLVNQATKHILNVKYTYDTNNKSYKHRLYNEKYSDELNQLARYNYKYKTKPFYLTENYEEPAFYRKKVNDHEYYEKINPITKNDDDVMIIDFENNIVTNKELQNLNKSNYRPLKELDYITPQEFNNLNQYEQKKYQPLFKSESPLTLDEYNLLSDDEKKNVLKNVSINEFDKLTKDQQEKTLQELTLLRYFTEEQYNRISTINQNKYEKQYIKYDTISLEEYEQLPDEEKEKYVLETVTKQKKIPRGTERLTHHDAYQMATGQLRKKLLKQVSEQQLLDYYGITFNDEINETERKQIIKNIREHKDLQGNKLNKEKFQELIDMESDEDKAYQEYLRLYNSNDNIIINDKLGDLYNLSLLPDFKERSFNLKRVPKSILRKKQQTEDANVEVSGYEQGKEVHFWTNEQGAVTFYNNQRDLYNAANGYKIENSAFYQDLYNNAIEQAQVEKQRNLTDLEIAQIENNILKRVSQYAEFNMNGKELAEYMGYKFGDNVPEYIYDQILENAALGLSPNGTSWIEVVNQTINDII